MNLKKAQRILFILTVFIYFTNFNIVGQNLNKVSVRGVLIDSISRVTVSYVSIALSNAVDNKIVKSIVSDDDGSFKFNNIYPGKYNIIISHVTYGKTSRLFTISGNEKTVDLGKIKLTRQSHTLDVTTIEGEIIPVLIKGDTIEFNALSFKTDTNAMIEELIRKLPGVEVDKDGNIKAQGKDVMRVFVDGKPFFGDDPKMATKNLPVDMFEKIQVIDKKSDQAIFTQIDDGDDEKIMNLITKKGKKNGFFGKATVGGGYDENKIERYDQSANINWFKDSRQFSIIGTLNNINNVRFSDFTSLDQSTKTAKNLLNKDISSTSGIYSANSSGISKSWSAGTNFRDSIGHKISFVSSYLYSGNDNNKVLTSSRQTFLSDSINYTNNNQNSPSKSINHNIHMEIDYGIDSMNSLLINPHLKINNNTSDQTNKYVLTGTKDQLLNTSNSEKIRDKNTINFNIEMLFRHKFHKPRRTLSLSIKAGTNPSTNEGYNLSYSTYGIDTTVYKVEHRKENVSKEVSYDAKISYTEPILYNVILEVNYHFKQKNSLSDRNTFNLDPITGIYNIVNTKLTNTYENIFQNHKAGINIKVFKYRWDYTIGVGVEPSKLISKYFDLNVNHDSTIVRNVVNFSPQLILNIIPRKGKKLTLKYKGDTKQPTVNQLQPIVDNSNPLYLYIGNPDLKPEFTNSLTFNYNTTNLVNYNYFYAGYIFESSINKLSNKVFIDTTGVQTAIPTNVNGTYAMNLNTGVGIPIKKYFLNLGCNTGYLNDINYLNNVSFSTKVLSFGFNTRLNYNGDRLTFAPIAKISLNKAWYDLQNRPDAQYLNYNLGFEFQADLFWDIKIGSDIQYIKNNGYGQGYNLDMTLWNAFISQQIFSNKRGILKFQIYDILNQNKSVFRTTSNNYIEDTKVNNLSQLFIVSFSYNFSKFQGKQPKVKSGEIKKKNDKKASKQKKKH